MSTVKKLKRTVGTGGQGEIELVKVPKIAIKLVAKYFNNAIYNIISGEIECLLKVRKGCALV